MRRPTRKLMPDKVKKFFHKFNYIKILISETYLNTCLGASRPKAYDLIFVRTNEIKFCVFDKKMVSPLDAGKLIVGDWDLHVRPLDHDDKYIKIYHQLSSENGFNEPTRLIERYSENEKYSKEEIMLRYRKLHDIYGVIKRSGYLKLQKEVNSPQSAFREKGGILVHIGRSGSIIFSRQGYHRLAISKYLGFSVIPVAVGVVHRDFFDNSKYKNLLSASRSLEKEYWLMRAEASSSMSASR